MKNLYDKVQIPTVSDPTNNRVDIYLHQVEMTSVQIIQLTYLNNLNIKQDLWNQGNVLLAAS
jgi:hypothetical protein